MVEQYHGHDIHELIVIYWDDANESWVVHARSSDLDDYGPALYGENLDELMSIARDIATGG